MILAGASSMVMAIVLGAFGAHGLKELIAPERLESFEVGVRYQIYHALGLLLLAALYKTELHRTMRWSATLMLIGTLLFSCSIYLLACRSLIGIDSLTSVLGPVTPLGGMLLIGSWVVLMVGILRTRW